MAVYRVYPGPDGESHIEPLQIEVHAYWKLSATSRRLASIITLSCATWTSIL
jgi:hypothetical protein